MKYAKTDKQDLVKDLTTGAILNINNEEYEAYKAHRDKMVQAFKASDELDELKIKFSKLEKILESIINTKGS
jgi:hypothetical protein